MKKDLMNRVLLNWFCTVLSMAGMMICLLIGLIPIAVVMFLAFGFCGIWMADIMAKWERRKRAHRAAPEIEDDICIDIPLNEAQDVPEAETREIRPGKRQSKTYLRMVEGGGTVYENRSADTAAQA